MSLIKSKRADANMWWIIIGAVIALVVLIVLLIMFTGRSGRLEGGLMDCESKGGKCGLLKEECTSKEKGGTWSEAFECPDKSGCCFGIKE
ncbi:MAG: hypothetical protein AB1668_07295 [Nanoarchaeota archaeon]